MKCQKLLSTRCAHLAIASVLVLALMVRLPIFPLFLLNLTTYVFIISPVVGGGKEPNLSVPDGWMTNASSVLMFILYHAFMSFARMRQSYDPWAVVPSFLYTSQFLQCACLTKWGAICHRNLWPSICPGKWCTASYPHLGSRCMTGILRSTGNTYLGAIPYPWTYKLLW